MKVTINASAVARSLQKYKRDTFAKCKIFLDALADEGVIVANPIISEARRDVSGQSMSSGVSVDYDYLEADDAIKTAVKKENGIYTIYVKYSGEDAMFIEFSSGITYGTTTFRSLPDGNPYGVGFGVGTYPGQTRAFDDSGWFYEKDGIIYRSWGNKAYMPLYHASDALITKIITVANRVFG